MIALASFLLVGDRLASQHGENACRRLLQSTIHSFGHVAVLAHKLSLSAFRDCDTLILLPGAKKKTKVLEIVIICWHIMWGRRVFLWYHNDSYNHWRWMAKTFGKRLGIGELCLQKSQAANRDSGIYFPNCVPSQALRCKKRKTLVWLSRLEVAKGVETAYHTWKLLSESDSDWKLLLIGPNGDWQIPGDKHCNFSVHGPAFGDDKFELLACGGVFIFPSKYKNETQPLVVIEALSVGLPMVISNINGIDELISMSLPAGISLPPDATPNEYAEATVRVYNKWEDLSANAFHNYSQFFSESAYFQRVNEILISSVS